MAKEQFINTKHPIYHLWTSMRQRCNDKNLTVYKNYGGRGIKISDRWNDFKNFAEDMYPTYQKGLTLDRIDNNGDYSKENCRWSSWIEQQNNRRNNHFFEYKGIRDTLKNWASYFNIKRSTLAQRIYVYKWNFEQALFGKEIN